MRWLLPSLTLVFSTVSRRNFCFQSVVLNRTVRNNVSLIQVSTYPSGKSFSFAKRRQKPKLLANCNLSSPPPTPHPRLTRAPSREPREYCTKEDEVSAQGSKRSPRLVTEELGARGQGGVGAEPKLGQWPPASDISAGPRGHAGWPRRQRNGMPHGRLRVTPALQRKAQAAWRKSRSKPAGRLAFPRTPCWSRVVKNDQWQQDTTPSLAPSVWEWSREQTPAFENSSHLPVTLDPDPLSIPRTHSSPPCPQGGCPRIRVARQIQIARGTALGAHWEV